MRRYLLKDGVPVQAIELDDDAVWEPPEGHLLAPHGYAPPAPRSAAPEPNPLRAEYAAATTTEQKLAVLARAAGLVDA